MTFVSIGGIEKSSVLLISKSGDQKTQNLNPESYVDSQILGQSSYSAPSADNSVFYLHSMVSQTCIVLLPSSILGSNQGL